MGVIPGGETWVEEINGREVVLGGYNTTQVSAAPISYIRPHHRSMARMIAVGMTPGEVARATGFTAGQITRILGSPMFQREVERLIGGLEDSLPEMQRDLMAMGIRAMEVLDEDLGMEVGESLQARRVRQAAAFEVLSRIVPKKTDSVPIKFEGQIQVNVDQMNVGQLESEIARRLAGAGDC